MKIYLSGNTFRYEIENIARLFMEEVEVLEGVRPVRGEPFAYIRLAGKRGLCFVGTNGKTMCSRKKLSEPELELSGMLYTMLCEITGVRPPWGLLTGIRPAKYVRMAGSDESARKIFCGKYLVRPDKAELAVMTADNSDCVRAMTRENSVSLYISIPFCPSRCSYCSFVSKTTERDGGAMLGGYLECLKREIECALETVGRNHLKLETVYVGGGTPSVLSADQLAQLTGAVAAGTDISKLREFTVEAGRPDTISIEKLAVLKRAGVSRICINPQTFNDCVLKTIGRRHSAADIDAAFAMAREAGFNDINADLIAGLPGDCPESFRNSLSRLLALAPEEITVHALTLKRASNMRESGVFTGSPAAEMVDDSFKTLLAQGYKPYYMYKQKGTVDNLENVGYAKPGHFCLYNVFIMDEVHTIIACGAGGVTKLVNPNTGYITRTYNYKYPAEYISGFDEILARKRRIDEFYKGCIFTED